MKALFLACLMLMMTGCAAIDVAGSRYRVPVQFATMKVIEDSQTITARSVLAHTNRVRGIITTEDQINITTLVDNTIDLIGLENLDASDRLLLTILFNNIEQAVADVRPDIPLEQQRLRLLTLLDWIDDAARLYQ